MITPFSKRSPFLELSKLKYRQGKRKQQIIDGQVLALRTHHGISHAEKQAIFFLI